MTNKLGIWFGIAVQVLTSGASYAGEAGFVRRIPEVGEPGVRAQEGKELHCAIAIPSGLTVKDVRQIVLAIQAISDKPVRSIEKIGGRYGATTLIDGDCNVGSGESFLIRRVNRKWKAKKLKQSVLWDAIALAPANPALKTEGRCAPGA